MPKAVNGSSGGWVNSDKPSSRGTNADGLASVTPKTEYPCVQLLEVLQGDEWRLSALLDLAIVWRESWFSKLHKETEENALEP